MKKKILLIILVSLFIIPVSVSAKTIKDYRNELAELKAEKKKAENNTAAVQEKINQAKARINEISRQISKTLKDKQIKEKEIKELDEKIDIKEDQIKELVAFQQISDNENFYLKYIFGAESFTDFIFRFSVIEQLTSASDDLITEMNDLIKQNKDKIKELEKKKKELDNLDKDIQKEIAKLGNKKKDYMEFSLSFDDEIRGIEKQIAYYIKQGCKETQNLNSCTVNVPSDKGFIKPMAHGVVTSPFGWRCDPYCGYHEGIDIGGNSTGVSVLAVAAGKVVYADVWGRGGNVIILNHSIRGVSYTTMYMHLSSYNVRKGSIVAQGQRIGGVGNTGNSFGTHLHFQVMTGHYYGTGNDSYSWGYAGHLITPTSVVNFPSGWW